MSQVTPFTVLQRKTYRTATLSVFLTRITVFILTPFITINLGSIISSSPATEHWNAVSLSTFDIELGTIARNIEVSLKMVDYILALYIILLFDMLHKEYRAKNIAKTPLETRKLSKMKATGAVNTEMAVGAW